MFAGCLHSSMACTQEYKKKSSDDNITFLNECIESAHKSKAVANSVCNQAKALEINK